MKAQSKYALLLAKNGKSLGYSLNKNDSKCYSLLMYSRYKAGDLIMNTVYGYKLFLNLDELEHANDMYFHKIIPENK